MSRDKEAPKGPTVDKPTRKRRAPSTKKRTRLLALEPRLLFDGALAADLSAKVAADSMPADAAPAEAPREFIIPAADRNVAVDASSRGAEAAPGAKAVADPLSDRDKLAVDLHAAAPQRNEIVFIDASVEGYEALVADVNPDAKIVLLDGTKDGIQQIAEYLSHESNIDAIHIVSHGGEGVLQLGTARLDAEAMRSTYASELIEIGSHLGADADILVYGCDFAKGAEGHDAATRLSLLTGADVAASDDLTGSSERGGDWDLEQQLGQIETSVAFGERAQEKFRYVLATLDWDTVQAGAGWSGSSGTYAVDGANVTVTVSDAGGDLAATPGLVKDVAAGGLTANTGGLSPAEYTLGLRTDFEAQASASSPTEQIAVTIDFAHTGGVSNVSFTIFDIDNGAWLDRLVVTGNNGAVLNPTSVVFGSAVAFDGVNTVTGIAGSSTTQNTGNATFTFSQTGITQITILYQSGQTADADVQQINLHDINFDAYTAPILDLDSTPSVVTVTNTVTTDLLASGSLGSMTGTSGNTPTGWTESGTTSSGAIQSNRYAWDGNVNANLTTTVSVTDSAATTYSSTASTLTETVTSTVNTITSIELDLAWQNADATRNNNLEVWFGGTKYATFTTGSNTTTGTWSYSGATGTSTSVTAVTNERTGTMTSNVITLNTPVAATGNLEFRYVDGPSSGTGSDDIAIDNVKLNSAATTTTTTTTVDLTSNGWTTTYTENGAAVSISDTDSSIFDRNSANLSSAVVTLTNYQTNDQLLVNGSTGASGTIGSINWVRSGSNGEIVSLSGSATKAQYADALRLITFSNSSDAPDTTDRTITVKVNDGTADSNVAVATIHVNAVNDEPTVTATGATATFTEGAGLATGTAVDLFSGVTVSAVEAGQTIASLVLAVTNVGTGDVLNIDGQAISLVAGTGSTTTNSVGYTITMAGSTATVTLDTASPALTPTQVGTLIDGMTFQNTSQNPAGSPRVVTLTTITDSGSNTAPSDNTGSPAISATITVAGTNDAAVLSTGTATLTETNAAQTASGTLTISDVDSPATYVAQTNVAGTYGTFSVDAAGAWTYAMGANNQLQAGQTYTDTFTVQSADGTATTVTVTINGTNDAAVLGAPTVSSVTKNVDVSGGNLVVSGTITISDPDAGQAVFGTAVGVVGSPLGSLVIAADGAYTYSVSSSAVQHLGAGQSAVDSFTVTSVDGTTRVVSFTINGAGDATPTSSVTLAPVVVLPLGTVTAPETSSSSGVAGVATGIFTGGAPVTTALGEAVLPGGIPVTGGASAAGAVGGPVSIAGMVGSEISSNAGVAAQTSSVPGTAVAGAATFGQGLAAAAPGVSAIEQINTLPATGAGIALQPGLGGTENVSGDRGFPVARLGSEAVPLLPAGTGATQASENLFVYQGMSSATAAVRDGIVVVPADAFGHTNPSAVVRLEASLADGTPLPGWIRFDGTTGVFSGVPPTPLAADVDIKVTARDDAGRQAEFVFKPVVLAQQGGSEGVGLPWSAVEGSPRLTGSGSIETQRATEGAGSVGGQRGDQGAFSMLEQKRVQGVAQLGEPGEQDALGLKQLASGAAGGASGEGQFAPAAISSARDTSQRGFEVVRLDVGVSEPAASSMPSAEGHRLFVFHGFADVGVDADQGVSFRIPSDAFAHTDPNAVVMLEARLLDGTPLPSWLAFNPVTGLFSGVAPANATGILNVEIVARDQEGRVARLEFALDLDATTAEEGVPQAATPDAQDLTLKMYDKDGKEAAKQKDGEAAASKDAAAVKGRPGEPEKERRSALNFGEQLKAAKATRDPLLSRILVSDNTGDKAQARNTRAV